MVCHQLVDGVGSALRNWTADPIYAYAPVPQPNDVFSPALYGNAMPTTSVDEPLCWLGRQIAADPGFARATVRLWFTTLTGQTFLEDPLATSPNYTLRLGMKLAQNAFLASTAQQFSDDNFNLRHMLETIITSPYFRASGVVASATSAEALQAGMFGHAQRAGPEQINRVINALTGDYWAATGAAPYMLNDFLISYGGIDSTTTTQRNTDMSSVMAAIANLMATQLPCQRTAADFNKDPGSRELFPYVELTTLPDDGAGTAKIKQNIRFLYAQLLGESVGLTDPEMDAAYSLFTTVYVNHANDTSLDPSCASGVITADTTHTLHAWMAIESSIFDDMEFLYE